MESRSLDLSLYNKSIDEEEQQQQQEQLQDQQQEMEGQSEHPEQENKSMDGSSVRLDYNGNVIVTPSNEGASTSSGSPSYSSYRELILSDEFFNFVESELLQATADVEHLETRHENATSLLSLESTVARIESDEDVIER